MVRVWSEAGIEIVTGTDMEIVSRNGMEIVRFGIGISQFLVIFRERPTFRKLRPGVACGLEISVLHVLG